MQSSRLRKMLVGLATFTLIAGAIVLYLVFYVDDRRDDLIERNFRVLSRISENVETKVRSIPRIALNSFSKEFATAPSAESGSVDLTETNAIQIILGQKMSKPGISFPGQTLQKNQPSTYTTVKKNPVQVSCGSALTDSLHEHIGTSLKNLPEDSVNVDIAPEGFISTYRFKEGRAACTLKVVESYQEFLRPLLREDVFRHYVLADSSGSVLYATNKLGVLRFDIHNWKDSRDLLEQNDQASSGSKNVWINTFTEMRIGGTEYRVFSHPFKLLNSEELMLIGLVPQSEFEQNTVHVSTFRLIFFTVIFVVLLLSYPFLKLAFISHNERMSFWDITSATIALFIATALTTLLILDIFRYDYYKDEIIADGLTKISEAISADFEEELTSTITQIKTYDSAHVELYENFNGLIDLHTANKRQALVVKRSQSAKQDLLDPAALTSQLNRVDTSGSLSYLQPLKNIRSEDFLNIAWVSDKGRQEAKWTPEADNTRKISVANREYFTEVRDKKMWSLNVNNRNQDFYLGSIISYNTGDLLAAISMPSKVPGHPVVTMTRQLHSLHNPVLSMGYHFAVVDASGKVLFHSDGKRNLQENLLEELTQKDEFTSLLLSRSADVFNSSYHGEEYLFRVEPLQKWPVFLLTYFEEKNLLAANSEILTFSLLSLALYAVLVILLLLFLVYYDSARSKLKYRLFRFNWVIPHPSSRNKYIVAILQTLVMGVFFVFFTWGSFQQGGSVYFTILFLLMALAVFSTGGLYLVLIHRFRSQTKLWLWLVVFILLLLGIGAAGFHKNIQKDLFLYYIGANLLLVIVGYFLSRLGEKPSSSTQLYNNGNSYRIYYRLMILSLLLLWTQPMVFCAFKVAHDTEFLLYNRLVQLDLAEKFENDFDVERLRHSSLNLGTFPSYHLSPLLDARISTDTVFSGSEHQFDSIQAAFLKTYLEVRPMYTEPTVVKTRHLGDHSGLRGKWFWEKPSRDSLNFYYQPGDNLLAIHSKIFPYAGPTLLTKGLILFIIPVLLLLFLLYVIIKFLYHKVVITNTSAMEKILPLESFIESDDGKNLTQDYICYIGLPHSGKTEALDQIRSKHPGRVQIIDLASLESQPEGSSLPKLRFKTALVVLDHFEYGMHKQEVNQRKLELLENLLSNGKTGIVLVSSVHPLDSILEHTSFDTERWVRALGVFKKTFYNLHGSKKLKPGDVHQEVMDLNQEELLERELGALSFLRKMKAPLLKDLKNRPQKHAYTNDELIIKIQSLAAFYYYSIWRTCTAEEKYLLYDMAQDGLLNTRNIRVINSLLNKGLIYHDGILKLINFSFRNFILSTVLTQEALEIEKTARQDSTWKKLRTPFILILAALAIFLFYTQRHILDNLTTLLTAVGTVVIALMRFSGTVGLKDKSSSAGNK